jgi:hypothetical protein
VNYLLCNACIPNAVMEGVQAGAALAALQAVNAPGLLALPQNTTAAEKCQHFLDYLGIYV